MSAWRQRAAERLDTAFSNWLFQVYRRPLWFLVAIMVLPTAIVLGVTYRVNASVASTQALNNLFMVAQLTSRAIGNRLSDETQLGQDVESIRTLVQEVRMEPEGFLYVADPRSQLVVYPFQMAGGSPKSAADWPPVAQPVPAEGHTIVFHEGGRGRRWLAGVHPIGTSGWRVVALQSDEAALRLLRQTIWPLGVLITLLLTAVVMVGKRWAALQELNLRLLEQNTKLLKESQQRWTLERGKREEGA